MMDNTGAPEPVLLFLKQGRSLFIALEPVSHTHRSRDVSLQTLLVRPGCQLLQCVETCHWLSEKSWLGIGSESFNALLRCDSFEWIGAN